MYAYDELDRTLLNERVYEFRDQVKRRLSGELTEDEFKLLRLKNGVYLQLHAYMLRVAIPYGTLSSKQLRMAGACRAQIRPRLRPFHHAAEHPVQLDQAFRPAGCAGRSRLRRHAWHADQRQLHPQRHHRPVGGRGAGRDRRSPHLGGAAAAVLDAASGILVPAAQVQDRHHRVRRTTAPRSRSTTSGCGSTRTAKARPASRCWSAAGSAARRSSRKTIKPFVHAPRHPELCRGDPARLQPVRPPRQHLQGAHQDPGARARHREVRRRKSRRNGGRSATARSRSMRP